MTQMTQQTLFQYFVEAPVLWQMWLELLQCSRQSAAGSRDQPWLRQQNNGNHKQSQGTYVTLNAYTEADRHRPSSVQPHATKARATTDARTRLRAVPAHTTQLLHRLRKFMYFRARMLVI